MLHATHLNFYWDKIHRAVHDSLHVFRAFGCFSKKSDFENKPARRADAQITWRSLLILARLDITRKILWTFNLFKWKDWVKSKNWGWVKTERKLSQAWDSSPLRTGFEFDEHRTTTRMPNEPSDRFFLHKKTSTTQRTNASFDPSQSSPWISS